MQIKINMQDAVFSAFAARLQKMGSETQFELARGLNEAGGRVTTLVRHRLKDQMNVLAYGTIGAHTDSTPASPGRLAYEITGKGRGLPIKYFPVQASAHGPVSAQTWGVAHTFKRSFKTTGKGLLLARLGTTRKPIRSLRGPSPAKELVKGETAAAFERAAHALVLPIIVKRLARLLP